MTARRTDRAADGHGSGQADGGHGHDHGHLDRDVLTRDRAVRTVWWSVAGLAATAIVQFAIVAISGSAGLYADALHNIGDVAGTASLLVAFRLSRRPANEQFTYGWRRAEDLAGLLILLAIALSAVLAGYDSLAALLGGGHEIRNVGWAFAAALVGVVGNEAVAQFKIRVGRDIDSVALVADGQHARTDGLVSGAAAVGIAGAWLGFPVADPLAGLAITVMIVVVLVRTGRDVLRRTMDAVDRGTVGRLQSLAAAVPQVQGVHDVRARFLGRSLVVQLHVEVDGDVPLRDAHAVAERVRVALVRDDSRIETVDVHVDPAGEHDTAHLDPVDEHDHGGPAEPGRE
jgi:cation diffusion facilitator family transporter